MRRRGCIGFSERVPSWLLLFSAILVAQAALEVAGATEEANGYAAWPKWILILFCGTTIVLSAMYCGLTIGLLGMETIYLEIIADAGQEPDRTYARKILPVRLLGHQLLATLLVGNMLTLVLTSQLVAAIVGGSELTNFIAGSVVILIFGEILPMSFCNNQNNALWAGTKSLPALKVSLFVLWPITKPLGIMLDCMVGHEAGQMYDRKELKKLIRVHCEKFSDKSGIDMDQVRMMLSAMDMNEVTVEAAMTPIDKAVMLEANTPLDNALERRLWEYGISRVPIYRGTRDVIIGVLYVKDIINLAYLGRNTGLTVRDFVVMHPRDMLVVRSDALLQETLYIFEHRHTQLLFVEPADKVADATGSSSRESPRLSKAEFLNGPETAAGHPDATPKGAEPASTRRGSKYGGGAHLSPRVITPMALSAECAQPRPFIGIVTLEDVIEELIASEIYDEDEYSGGDELISDDGVFESSLVESPPTRPPRVNLYSYGVPPAWEDESLTEDQLWALSYYLTRAYVFFATWNVSHVKYLLHQIGNIVVRVKDAHGSADELNSTSSPAIATAMADLSTLDPARVLYRAGQPSTAFTLLLSGGMEVTVGSEGVRTELRSFSALGEGVFLSEAPFLPDYTAVISRTSRLIRITHADLVAVENKLNHERARRRLKPVRLTPGSNPAAMVAVATSPSAHRNRKDQMRGEDKRVTIE